ncbi:MAG: hypothetical protein ACM3TN_05215 [Alphaproteobacteria bacterium]
MTFLRKAAAAPDFFKHVTGFWQKANVGHVSLGQLKAMALSARSASFRGLDKSSPKAA